MAEVNWLGGSFNATKFSQLKCGDTFRYSGPNSKGAVYMKTYDVHGDAHALELATGCLFPGNSNASIDLVKVVINIQSNKPNL